jgi:type I restriction enzyme M protein
MEYQNGQPLLGLVPAGVLDHQSQTNFQTSGYSTSSLYEDKIKRMGNAGRNGGEYYTPRPLIKTIVRVVNPK